MEIALFQILFLLIKIKYIILLLNKQKEQNNLYICAIKYSSDETHI